jgi:flagellar M-ring protein FliF
MPARVQSALGRLIGGIREFTVAQRTLAIIGTIGVVVGAIALGAWLMKPTYAPLFSGLSGTDASAIVEQLKTAGVSYELADGGTTILVPQEKVDQQRLAAAAAGLPGDKTAGYSLLDNMGVTTSEFQQTVTYKRALEGELSKTIEGLDGVRTASVKLAIPEQTVFVSQKTDPTASVFLDTKPGVSLSDEQVKAVTHLVSASVDGMKPADVAVVDADGDVLSSVGGTDAAGSDSGANDYETKTAAALQAMLDKVVGPGNATVVVTADVSKESAQRTQETYTTPDGNPAINESTQTDGGGSGSGSGTGSSGVLGPDNIAVPGGTVSGSGTDGSGSASGTGTGSSSVVRNNAIDKTTETRTIPAGELTKQAVSVAINSDKVKTDAATIKSMVAAAAGIDTKRGDVVSVQRTSFAKTNAADAKAALDGQRNAEGASDMTDLIRTGIIVVGVLAGIVIVLMALFRLGRRRAEQTELALGELDVDPIRPTGIDALIAAAEQPRLDGTPAPASIAPPEPILPTDLAGVEKVRASVEAMAGADPERTAEYLRSLMDDRQPA